MIFIVPEPAFENAIEFVELPVALTVPLFAFIVPASLYTTFEFVAVIFAFAIVTVPSVFHIVGLSLLEPLPLHQLY